MNRLSQFLIDIKSYLNSRMTIGDDQTFQLHKTVEQINAEIKAGRAHTGHTHTIVKPKIIIECRGAVIRSTYADGSMDIVIIEVDEIRIR